MAVRWFHWYSTRARGIEALKLAIDRYKENDTVELVHYAQPLLQEADSLADAMAKDMPLKQRRWLGLQMLEAISTAAPMRVMPRKISMPLSHA